MNNVKIRASYGEMGDDNVGGYGDFDYLGGYTFNQGSAIIAVILSEVSTVRLSKVRLPVRLR